MKVLSLESPKFQTAALIMKSVAFVCFLVAIAPNQSRAQWLSDPDFDLHTKQGIDPGRRQADGTFVFDFVLRVKVGADADRPVFGGPYASGPADDRFVYLSWRRIDGAGYINRVKARLGGIDWVMVRAAQAEDRPLTADITGWTPHDHRKSVLWR